MIAQPGPGPAAPALVGREREQAALREALAAVLAGRGALVLIGGEAGIGKTTLAEWLCAEATNRGALVLVGRCYDLSETPPYGPWVEAFARAPAGDGLPALPAAVLPPERDGAALADQAAVARRVLAYLTMLAATRPLVLLLDDLHWADPATLDLLRFLARQLADLPLLLLATYRADEVALDHPLAGLLPLLVREARAARIDLRPLDAAAIGTLVAARYALADADRARLVDYLAGRSDGNALFLGELLRTLEGAGALGRAGDRWILGDLAEVPVPTLLRQLIAGRLARLDRATQRLLTIASVIGHEVPLALWVAAARSAEDALLGSVEPAIAAQLLAETLDGLAVRFAHALVREALYEATTALQRRRLHRQIGELLAAMSAPDPDAVAYHFRRAGDARAVEWLVRAGERAQRAWAAVTAAERYAAAQALLAGDDARAGERGWVLIRLARQRQYADPEGGLATADEAARLAAAVGDPTLAAAALAERGYLEASCGENARGLATLEAGAAAVETLVPDERARINRLLGIDVAVPQHNPYWAVLAGLRSLIGPFPVALGLWEQLAGRAPDVTAGPPAGDSSRSRAVTLAMLGRPSEARRAFAEASGAYRAAGDHFHLGMSAELELKLVILPYLTEQRTTRQRLAAAVEAELGRASGAGVLVPRFFCASLLLLEGAWGEVHALALEVSAGTQFAGPRRDALGWLGRLARERGEPDAAWARVRAALSAGQATAVEEINIDGPRLLWLAVALALDAGDLATAREWLEAYDHWLAWSGAVLFRAEGQLNWSAYHRTAGDATLARQHAERALAQATEPRQPLALLAAHRLLGELDTERGDFATASAQLAAALALAEACEAPYERALTLLALAELHAATGERDAAQAALATARALVEPLDARPALARAATLATRLVAPPAVPQVALPFGLTAREAEVLKLVAAGLTDQQIADRLLISRNTVNTHTRAVYGKLGVTSRAAATRLALAHNLA